jgi:hypothetical protein
MQKAGDRRLVGVVEHCMTLEVPDFASVTNRRPLKAFSKRCAQPQFGTEVNPTTFISPSHRNFFENETVFFKEPEM